MGFGLVVLLRAAWSAAIIPFVLASIPSSKLRSFHGAMSLGTNRGKTLQPSSKFTVPQRFFSHFYMVATVWTTILLLATWTYSFATTSRSTETIEHRYGVWHAVFLLLLMEAQVVRRLFESLYVFSYRQSARMHIFLYLSSICYYIAAPLSLCCSCAPEVFRFTLNLLSQFISEEGKKLMPAAIGGVDVSGVMKVGWYQWVGSAIFLWGWIHQLRCHAILGRIRAHGEHADGYVIPRGNWFEIVSCPHYLAEIVIYFGLVVASGGGDLTIWLLLGAVVVNLVFAAAETHRWYIAKFEDYPTNRFAIIPFIF
ncbi:Polyprenol reductase 1 [Hibiscus trionum]|uniref:Polyprenol reductase 1 n=1 Tax=Hibiscus trionum TaxID=183268 RepID=A0A9W7ML00_HIBTR|nr:Polyprenol reductase 1 [Hibiscus trionum]